MRLFLFSILCTVCLGGIGYLFWIYEWQYNIPTPIPKDLIEVETGEKVDSTVIQSLKIDDTGNYFIHFYNNDCPCSRFNSKEFKTMVYKFGSDIQFIAVVEGVDRGARNEFREKYDLSIPIFWDNGEQIATKLGVYATPQAVIVNKGKLFYKGNYNRARFCTSRNTKFAEIALTNLLAGKEAPYFPELAKVAYGCELPSEETNTNFLLF